MPKLTPRPYQREALEAARAEYEQGNNRMLTRMPTGCGKTAGYAVNLLDYFPEHTRLQGDEGGVLFLSHRIEIIRQAYRTFEDAYGHDHWIGLEQGPSEATGYEDFIFASVDSVGRMVSDRIHKYADRKFGLIIADEGHHVTRNSTWDRILNYFGVGSDEQMHYSLRGGRIDPVSVFLTATPERNDGQPLTPFLDAVAYDYKIRDAIRDGWLTDIRAYKAFEEAGKWEKMDDQEQVDFLIRTWKEYAQPKQTLCFAGSVDQSALLARTLNAEGITTAGHVDAETDADERERIIHQYREGQINFLTNRLVYTEGFDHRGIQCILDNGPTESEPLHIQKVGRGLRPHPAADVDACDTAEERKAAIAASPKPFLLYVSTFDPTVHSLDVEATIMGTGEPFDAEGSLLVEEVVDVIEEEEAGGDGRPAPKDVSSMSELEVALNEVDIWDRTIRNDALKAATDLRWVLRSETDAGLWLPENPAQESARDDTEAMLHVVEDEETGGVKVHHIRAGGWVPELGHPVKAKVQGTARFDSLAEATRKIDQWLRGRHPDLYARLLRDGTGRPATSEQKRYMKNHGIPFGEGIKSDAAQLLIDDFKQSRKLDQTGLME